MDRRYEPIKEYKEWYFTEYHPPVEGYRFATLYLIILEKKTPDDVATAMENELKLWLKRYSIPIMVTSFDDKGNIYDLSTVRPINHLIGFLDENNNICSFWELLGNEKIPDIALNSEFVNRIYSNLNFKTYEELDNERKNRRRRIKTGWFIFFLWLVIIPALVAILEYYSDLLSLIVLVYSLCKAIKKGLELTGKWPKSKKEKDKEREDQLKDHYYYHCKLNPEGFRKIMQENLENLSKEETLKEANSLKQAKKKVDL